MSTRIVTTQAELDAALAAGETPEIKSNRRFDISKCTLIYVSGSSQPHVEARGSSQPHVVAWGSSQPHVVARGSSQPHVEARGSSQPHVVAWESSQPHVEAWESSQPHVVAWESSQPHVEAWESSQLQARGDMEVRASAYAVVTCDGKVRVIEGTNVIRVPDLHDPAAWCDYHGVKVSKTGTATLYKAVNDEWTTDYGFDYSPGSKLGAPDWRDDNECGGGLHFGPTPRHAREYNLSATRYVEVGVKVADLRPILGGTAKCKAPKVVRACREVDIDGRPVSS